MKFKKYLQTLLTKPIQQHPTSNTSTESIKNIEENALQYVAGYIYMCQKIISQLKKWKHEHKEILLFFMSDTSGSEKDIDKDTETWTNLLDKGGLYHVSDITYDLFYHMELELRKYFNLRAKVMEANTKPFII